MPDIERVKETLGRLSWLWILLAWGGLILSIPLIHFGELPIEEGAARGLLLNWSIYHQVASPIVLLGIPDLRAMFFIPVTLYWPGSLVAPRVLWILIAYAALLMLYRWMRGRLGQEQALIVTGLLLVAPFTFTQIDSLGAGIFLLFCFLAAHWMEHRYEASGRPLGGWFYMRFLWAAVTVSVHPAGLAYPLALLWHVWRDESKPTRLKKQSLAGLTIALLLLGLLQAGWHAIHWGADPLAALTAIFHSTDVDPFPPVWEPWLIAAAAVVFAGLNFRRLWGDLFGTMLTSSLVLGALAADTGWAYLVFVFITIWAFDGLIRLQDRFGGQGLIARRGGVLLLLIVCAVVFTREDRAYAQMVRAGIQTPHAILLQEVAVEVESLGKFARVLSQWPGQTMLVCKCDVLMLPPGSEDPQQFLEWMRKARATHLVFDPRIPENKDLARDIALLGDAMRTLFVNEAGVIVGVMEVLEEAAKEAEKAREEEALPEEVLKELEAPATDLPPPDGK